MKTYPENPVLLVDDEVHILEGFAIMLKFSGINNTITCGDSREVMAILEKQPVELILLDLLMPHLTGEELLRRIHELYPQIPVIIITATNDVDTAVRCMKYGAVDYMMKPVERSRLVTGIKRILELQWLKRENLALKNRILEDRLQRPALFEDIVTGNEKIVTLFKYMEAIAPSEEPVLITGETGVGKELFAHAIHKLSRLGGSFVSVNVSGLDDNVFSDTLFGHKKGAFTDAHQVRKGLVEQAVGGTLFLDEIGDLNPASQVKLLRLLQEKEYYPLGSDTPSRARVRAVFSTNRDLEALMKTADFRSDLYYRIHTHHIHVPPLRERMRDLPLLLEHFIKQAAEAIKKNPPDFPPELISLLGNYSFPGNVRELRALVFDALSVTKNGDLLSLKPFKKLSINGSGSVSSPGEGGPVFSPLDFSSHTPLPAIKDVEDALIAEALKRSSNNISLAARMLGLTRQTLSKRLKKKG